MKCLAVYSIRESQCACHSSLHWSNSKIHPKISRSWMEHYVLSVFCHFYALEFAFSSLRLLTSAENSAPFQYTQRISSYTIVRDPVTMAAVATATAAIFFMLLPKRILFTFCSFHWTFTYLLFLHFLCFQLVLFSFFSSCFVCVFPFIFYLLIKKMYTKNDTIVLRTVKYSFVKLQHSKTSRKKKKSGSKLT